MLSAQDTNGGPWGGRAAHGWHHTGGGPQGASWKRRLAGLAEEGEAVTGGAARAGGREALAAPVTDARFLLGSPLSPRRPASQDGLAGIALNC